MGDRATCWSITINNPTPQDLKPSLPMGWSMVGQMEEGKEGTEHYQGCLRTPQVRFSAVKKHFPRAHIEIARNRPALELYVQKSETRVAAVQEIKSEIPNLFEYQYVIARKWDDQEFNDFVDGRHDREAKLAKQTAVDDLAVEFVDILVSRDIEDGKAGVEYIAVNPMWRSSWKKFWRAILTRERKKQESEATNVAELAADSQTEIEED